MSEQVKAILTQIGKLTPEEYEQLYREIEFRKRLAESREPRRKWSEIQGSMPYPTLDEDAQARVTRERATWQERERKLRGE